MTNTWQPDSAVLEHFLLGFEGTRLPGELRSLLARGLAGVAIFRRNWTTLDELCSLTREIREAAGRPVLIGIDQEGGTKFSLPEPFTQWPCPADLGLLDDAGAVEQIARAMARELRAVGVNLNFAPMLDLHINPESPVTTRRSFGADPEQVARLGRTFLRGLEQGGVLGCAKHYPGHGDAHVDPHEDLPVFHGDRKRLEQVELVPFREAVAAGVPLVMTAHILLPKIDPEHPASLSRTMLQDVLRRQFSFGGVILIDDIGMGAIRRRYGLGDAAVRAIQAGTDLVAICHDWPAVQPTIEAVEKAEGEGAFDAAEWQASRARITHVLGRAHAIPPLTLEVVGCAEHRARAVEIREKIAKIGQQESAD